MSFSFLWAGIREFNSNNTLLSSLEGEEQVTLARQYIAFDPSDCRTISDHINCRNLEKRGVRNVH